MLVIHDCPYRRVSQSLPLVCEIDLALIGALLKEPFKMTQCMAGGDAVCQFVLDRKK
jgi:predicted ArsR family transcriptional regulator